MQKEDVGIFRALFEAGRQRDLEALADSISDDCEWVLMPNMKSYKGRGAIVELCTGGKLASNLLPEIIFDEANARWGVFEYINRGIITKELSAFVATSRWQLPSPAETFLGKQFEVPVCFVYHLNGEGKIHLIHEYLDLSSLMKQFS